MHKEIILNGKYGNGKVAMVDSEDYANLKQHKWYVDIKGYCYRNGYKDNNKRTTIKMHREIMKPKDDEQIDHVNHIKLDNRKANLRITDNQNNSYNRGKYNNKSTSRFKGVKIESRTQNYWVAFIKVKGKQKYLGHYTTEESAAYAYNLAAMEHHGEYACLNNVPIVKLEKYTYKPKTSSQYVGVSKVKRTGKWVAYIKHKGKQKTLGTFSSEEEAYTRRCQYLKDIG